MVGVDYVEHPAIDLLALAWWHGARGRENTQPDEESTAGVEAPRARRGGSGGVTGAALALGNARVS